MNGSLHVPDDKRASAYSLRRFFGVWALTSFWMAVGSLFLGAVYVASTRPFEFDTELEHLRREGLVWALQLGSVSCSKLSTTQIGLNAENLDFEREQRQVWYGTLDRTYQGTYLAYFHGEHWPTVLTVVRSVGETGHQVSSAARQNGWKLIVHYLFFYVLMGFFGAVAIELFRRRYPLVSPKRPPSPVVPG